MTKNKLMTELVTSAMQGLATQGVYGKKEVVSMLSTESIDDRAKSTIADVNDSIETSITAAANAILGSTLSTESITAKQFRNDVQVKAAAKAAMMALDPVKASEALQNINFAKDARYSSADDVTSGLSTEAFDDQSIKNSLAFSLAYNFSASQQDPFGEAFFPTIVLDPVAPGVTIDVDVISLMDEVERSSSGSRIDDKLNKRPVLKHIYNPETFGVEKNKVIPVNRTASQDKLVTDITYMDNSTGELIKTSPLKFKEEVDLLGISQTDAMLAKGKMDNTDMLDRSVTLEKVYLKITGQGTSGTVTEFFEVRTTNIPGAVARSSHQGHEKDMSIDIGAGSGKSDVTFVLSTDTTKKHDGNPSEIMAKLGENGHYQLGFKMVINGTLNVETGNVKLYANELRLTTVRDAAGHILSADASEVSTLKAALGEDKAVLVGYSLDAYRTNSNLRTRGTLLTQDNYTFVFNVYHRSGFTILAPIEGGFEKPGNLKTISNLASMVSYKTSNIAVKTLTDYVRGLEEVARTGQLTSAPMVSDSIAQFAINPFYAKLTVDISTSMDSVSAHERQKDIQASLLATIKDAVIRMVIDSNYKSVYDNVYGKQEGPIKVIVGTTPRIAPYLCGSEEGGTIKIGDEYELVIVTTLNQLMKDKIILTFGIFNSDRNTAPNELNFGQMYWAPTLVVDTPRASGSAHIRVVQNQPRFLHIPNLPTATEIVVTGIPDAIGRIGIKTVS